MSEGEKLNNESIQSHSKKKSTNDLVNEDNNLKESYYSNSENIIVNDLNENDKKYKNNM